jgi:hypothetical protein
MYHSDEVRITIEKRENQLGDRAKVNDGWPKLNFSQRKTNNYIAVDLA